MKLMHKIMGICMLVSFSGMSQVDTGPTDLTHHSIQFIKNNGQWHSNVNYRAPLGTGSVYLEDNKFTYVQVDPEDLNHSHDHAGDAEHAAHNRLIDGHAWRATFIGANENPKLIGVDKLTTYHNYFIGNDKSKWASNVPLFNQVAYENLYPGIDLEVYSANNHFKYDFMVAPGGDPAHIQMQYSGLDGIAIKNGNLVTLTSIGEFIENAPYAYQIVNGEKQVVNCAFVLENETVRFDFPDGYNANLPLVIDPELIGASLSGSTVTNYGHCATYDSEENIYTGARSFGIGYPTEDGSFQTDFGGSTDIAISKLNPDASVLLYATYLGGSGSDLPHSMVANDINELYVFGTTQSLDYPVSDDAFDTSGPDGGFSGDIFITHLNETGTDVVGSTFVGGSDSDGINDLTTNYGDDFRGEIIVDPAGNCYIASCTQSTDFPVTAGVLQTTYGGGSQDAVIFSMNPELSEMIWSTYMGSTFGEGALGLRLDFNDDLYVTGATDGEFMSMSGYQSTYQGGTLDAYVIRLIDNGEAISESSYWGTEAKDAAFFVDLDNDGNVFLYGQSDGGTSEVTDGVYVNEGSKQFICKLSPTLSDLEFGTVVGDATANFVPIAFMVDACGYIYFSGHGAYGTLPLTPDALYTEGGFYLGVLQPEAADLEFSTKYSGGHVDGGTSRFDPERGIVYQAVCSCGPFTTTPDAWSNVPGGGCDMGVFKIDFGISHVSAQAVPSPSAEGCIPFEVDFTNASTGLSYQWDFGDGSPTTTEFEPTHTFTTPGIYSVQLVAFDPEGCLTSDTTYLEIIVGSGETPDGSFEYDVNCATGAVTINYTGTDGAVVVFDMGDGNTYTETDFTHTYASDGIYTVTLTAGDGFCAGFDVVSETIDIGTATVDIVFNRPTCSQFSDGSLTIDIDDPTGMELIEITDPAGTLLNVGGSNTANTLSAGWYYYYVDLGDGCEVTDSIQISDPEPLNAQINVTHPLCYGDETGIAFVDTVYNWQANYDDIVYIWAPDPDGVSGIGANELTDLSAGTYILTLNDGNGCSRQFEFEITEPEELSFSEFGSEPAYCRLYGYQSGNGEVYGAATGGVPDYHYDWEHIETGNTTEYTTWGGRNPGTYVLTVSDENGCELTGTIVLDSLNPKAMFTATTGQLPTDCDAIIPVNVNLTNQSQHFVNPNDPEGDTTFTWNFNHPADTWIISHDIDEVYDITYTQTGTYEICLVAMNKNGCTDTLCQTFKFCEDLEFEPINIFTPNGDGINDQFTFVDRSKAVKEFQCTVVNRWGIVIAEFNSITQSWDGTDKNGDYVADGVYFYIYSGEGETGEEFSGQGNVQVVDSPK